MPTVHQPKLVPEYDDTRRSEVIGVTPAHLYPVSWVDADGRKSICLAIVFGQDAEDGGPGIFILADELQMKEDLRLANSIVKDGVRRWLEEQNGTVAADVPDVLGHIDIEGVGGEDTPEDSTLEGSDIDPLAGMMPA